MGKPYSPDPDEDSAIERGVSQDPDNPKWTDEDFPRSRRTADIPELRDLFEARRESNELFFDAEVADRLQAQGPDDWRARANAILRKAVGLD